MRWKHCKGEQALTRDMHTLPCCFKLRDCTYLTFSVQVYAVRYMSHCATGLSVVSNLNLPLTATLLNCCYMGKCHSLSGHKHATRQEGKMSCECKKHKHPMQMQDHKQRNAPLISEDAWNKNTVCDKHTGRQ